MAPEAREPEPCAAPGLEQEREQGLALEHAAAWRVRARKGGDGYLIGVCVCLSGLTESRTCPDEAVMET